MCPDTCLTPDPIRSRCLGVGDFLLSSSLLLTDTDPLPQGSAPQEAPEATRHLTAPVIHAGVFSRDLGRTGHRENDQHTP